MVLRLWGHRLARTCSDSRSVLKLRAPAAVVSREARLRLVVFLNKPIVNDKSGLHRA